MAEQQPHSHDEIVPKENADMLRSIVPNLGMPYFESARYKTDANLYKVWPDGRLGVDVVHLDDGPERVKEALSIVAHRLAWIEFQASMDVVMRHSQSAIQEGVHSSWSTHLPLENFRDGSRFKIGETHFVTDFSQEDGVTLRTHSQVLESGELTPYMSNWMKRLVSFKGGGLRPSSAQTEPFHSWIKD
jgi:hypothetical protein